MRIWFDLMVIDEWVQEERRDSSRGEGGKEGRVLLLWEMLSGPTRRDHSCCTSNRTHTLTRCRHLSPHLTKQGRALLVRSL
jgi:hypothetical protein